MVRGINQSLGDEQANCLIRRVFEERFGPNKVVCVRTIKRTDNIQTLFKKKQIYEMRVEFYKMRNKYESLRETITIGSKLRCNLKTLDAQDYYEKKLDEVKIKWEEMKYISATQNIGIAFVSFREKDCVNETTEEIDIVKTKLQGKEHYDKLHLKEWEVEQACYPSDIIWTELNKNQRSSIVYQIALFLLPYIVSIGLSLVVTYFEYNLSHNHDHNMWVAVTIQYFSPIILCCFNYYTFPWIISRVIQNQGYEKKSSKEQSFVSKNTLFLLLNTLILPFLFQGALTSMT